MKKQSTGRVQSLYAKFSMERNQSEELKSVYKFSF